MFLIIDNTIEKIATSVYNIPDTGFNKIHIWKSIIDTFNITELKNDTRLKFLNKKGNEQLKEDYYRWISDTYEQKTRYYSNFDKWQDGQYIEDTGLFTSIKKILLSSLVNGNDLNGEFYINDVYMHQ